MSRSRLATLAALLVAILVVGLASLYASQAETPEADAPSGSADASPTPSPTSQDPASTEGDRSPEGRAQVRVLVITIDGLSSEAIEVLGPRGAPALHRMIRDGASTLNARTAVEQTETLPNHISMVTGLRIDAARGGHGVTWNDGRLTPYRVHEAAGREVESIFDVAHGAGYDAAVYASKPKFSLMERSWPLVSDSFTLTESNVKIARKARRGLHDDDFDLALAHFSLPDEAGHAHGWMSPRYLDAVRRTDARVGLLLDAISEDPALSDDVTVILTADHGGLPGEKKHAEAELVSNYRIPFLMWGRSVTPGTDLYDLSPQLTDPGDARVGYDGPQPVRNGFAANAAAELLDLKPIRDSQLNTESELNWAPS